jgi:flavodoxin
MTQVDALPIRPLLVLVSYHHMNTEKIARVLADVLDAPIRHPKDIHPEEIQGYDLIGFGSGIYDGMHHKELLQLAERLPVTDGKRAFLFSTSAIVNDDKVAKDHSALRSKLQQKGYEIVDEFACKGYNTNSFLKYFGGMNKGRPNQEDIEQAERFALKLKREDPTNN